MYIFVSLYLRTESHNAMIIKTMNKSREAILRIYACLHYKIRYLFSKYQNFYAKNDSMTASDTKKCSAAIAKRSPSRCTTPHSNHFVAARAMRSACSTP